MPHLRVVAGTSLDDLQPITVNTGTPYPLKSDVFDGAICAFIRDFPGPNGEPLEHEYFEREDRKRKTWSIQVQGRFLRPISADDILFGNAFDRPLQLPWGVSAAFRFMKFIDPTLKHDLTSRKKPWALSPFVSTMPHLTHTRVKDGVFPPPFPSSLSVSDDVSDLHLTVQSPDISPVSSPASSHSGSTISLSTSSSSSSRDSDSDDEDCEQQTRRRRALASARKLTSRFRDPKPAASTSSIDISKDAIVNGIQNISTARDRRQFFMIEDHRRNVVFGPDDVISTDFCYGYINFSPSLTLQLPGGISFDLMRYWDGQAVRFVCCEKKDDSDCDDTPWGRIFWCIAIELVDD